MGILSFAAIAAAGLAAAEIVPELPRDPAIPGFQFPESEAAITGWITAMSRGESAAPAATEKMHRHGWGLWSAVTAPSRQLHEGQILRIFETWLSPDDLTEFTAVRRVSAIARTPRRRTALRALDKLDHFEENANARGSRPRAAAIRETAESRLRDPILGDASLANRVLGFVKFDPSAAEHILQQELLSTAALDALVAGGVQQIPPFPATALVVKPLYQVFRAGDLIEGRYLPLKVWSGPPPVPQALPPSEWRGVAWIDVLQGGFGRDAIDEEAAPDGSSRSEETTYPLSSLMSHRLSPVDAATLNAAHPGTDASAGDYALLVAMHVAGREIARWTWQTFWWTPNPDDPPPPSSAAIAAARPAQLTGSPRNYAMAMTYMMTTPDQPHIAGENAGAAVYGYNPWLEARFEPAQLPDSLPGIGPDGRPAANNFGIQTNCMSCHARATYNPLRRPTAPRFAGARYVDLADPRFVGTLQVDFLWSIARHAR